MWIQLEHLNRVLQLVAAFVRCIATYKYHFFLMSYAVLYVIQYFTPLVIEYPFYFLDSAPSSLLSLFSQGHSGPKEKSTRLLFPFYVVFQLNFLILPPFLKFFPKKTSWPGWPAVLPSPSMAPHCCPQDARLIHAGDHLGWRGSQDQRSTTHPPPTNHICGCKTPLPTPLWSWLWDSVHWSLIHRMLVAPHVQPWTFSPSHVSVVNPTYLSRFLNLCHCPQPEGLNINHPTQSSLSVYLHQAHGASTGNQH